MEFPHWNGRKQNFAGVYGKRKVGGGICRGRKCPWARNTLENRYFDSGVWVVTVGREGEEVGERMGFLMGEGRRRRLALTVGGEKCKMRLPMGDTGGGYIGDAGGEGLRG